MKLSSSHKNREAREKAGDRRTVFFRSVMSSAVLDFPELTEDDLELLFTWTYRLGQPISHLGKLMPEDGDVSKFQCTY